MYIGIVGYSIDGKNLFSNGYGQNVIFFCKFMEKYFTNHTIIPINDGNFTQKHDRIDLFIMFAPLDKNGSKLIRKKYKGCKVVFVKYGHEYYNDLQRLLPKGQNDVMPAPKAWDVDEVWISPHFESTKYYYEELYQAEVKIMPYIWEPINITIPPFTPKDFNCEKVIYIIEPTINLFKTSLIPILIVNQLWRKYPDSFDKVVIASNNNVNAHEFFNKEMLGKIEVLHGHHNKAFFAPRLKFNGIFKKPGILLNHQENWGLNYMYLEALHIRIPWVHNSEYFQDVGYYYNNKNIPEGVEALKRALDEFKPTDYDYIMERYNPHNPMVIKEYKKLIVN